MFMDFIVWLAVGALCGWIASKIFKTEMGLLGYIIVGILGSVLGGFLFGLIGINLGGFVGTVISSVVGALVLLFVLNKIKK